ncbi:DnaD domain protein [Mesobacillus subterraneus]|uniref:DnaD domain-containing protein n=1 Tax=Mesobacillus subterraneus TaxID=285983 RepID=UPI002041488E|nr:DnaD domain protein [Mesobacillus subterraneus]MCM3573318.1 DnaD domain protein [Mesobacillus subterraneus]
MGGAFQTSREIFNNPIWQDVIKFRLFFYIVGNAVFSEEGVKQGSILIKRGQYLRSYRNLAADLEYLENKSLKRYSLSVIKKKIDQLVMEKRLKVEETELGTLFTVVNYALYQGFEHYKTHNREQSENGARTVREQSENNNNNVKKVKKDITTATTTTENPIQLFEKLLCRLSINQMNSLNKWVDDFNGQEEILYEAIRIADDKNKRYFGFVEFLLKEWSKNNLTSLDRIRAFEQEKFNKYQSPRSGKATVRKEQLPGWFEKKKLDEQNNTQPIEDQSSIDDVEAERAKLEEELRQFKK